jgi:hypothetical protein
MFKRALIEFHERAIDKFKGIYGSDKSITAHFLHPGNNHFKSIEGWSLEGSMYDNRWAYTLRDSYRAQAASDCQAEGGFSQTTPARTSPVGESREMIRSTAMRRAFSDTGDDELQSYIRFLERNDYDPSRNPFNFWNEKKKEYPKLYRVAMKHLCIPLSSSVAERKFSIAKKLANCNRNRIKNEKLSLAIFHVNEQN